MKKNVCSALGVLLAAALLLPAAGCRGKRDRLLRVDMDGRVGTLDPQLAEGELSDVVLQNTMEGLVRMLPDGALVNGAAGERTVSPDGLTHVFRLRPGAVWSDGEPLTAADFVFAFHRLSADPQRFERFSAIRNSRSVLSGERPPGDLGVRAEDGRTLVIELERADPHFSEKLASPEAFPCREALFRGTHSRYGNGLEYMVFNGPYAVTAWEKDQILLTPNPAYTGDFPARNDGVRLYLNREDSVGRFLSGLIDFAAVDTDTARTLPPKAATVLTFQNGMTELLFNRAEGSLTDSRDLRRALCLAVDLGEYAEAGRLPEHETVAHSFAPPATVVWEERYERFMSGGFRLGETVFREETPGGPAEIPSSDCRKSDEIGYFCGPGGAKAPLLDSGMRGTTGLTLMLEEGSGWGDLAGWLQGRWLKRLNLIVNIEEVPRAVFEHRLLRGEYTLAIVSYTAGFRAGDVFGEIRDGSVPLRYDSPRYRQLLILGGQAESEAEAARYYANAEAMLFDEAAALPLFSGFSCFAVRSGVAGVGVSPDGKRIFFPGATVG